MRQPLVLLNAVVFRVMDLMWQDDSKARHKTLLAVSWVLMLHCALPQLLRERSSGYDADVAAITILGLVIAPLINYGVVYWRRDAVAEFYALYRQPRATRCMPWVLVYVVLSFCALNYALLFLR
ncbi:hypothetical protein LJ737_10625 [Hymenobacter sp. 15J16-1T3B]|uniref:hypothetical protein n=1 Tax=Hymenobacter sp. 15J16-1T3B TaxID=2886941 RepID=UPI001D123FFA|nr:hypothetical protein [Hymenobacter sp. 15J16-1T3B]MCC3157696.1 hypothetical protein [Hymenobacter sp. 15J16-1T3B]